MKHLFSNGGRETYNQGELINPISWKNQQNISPPSQQGSIKEDYLRIPHQVYNLGLHLPFHLPFGNLSLVIKSSLRDIVEDSLSV